MAACRKGAYHLAAVILDSRKEALSEKIEKEKNYTLKEEKENGDF